tara:strand:+ start:652 stop:909 length:258 start_codon:yes stop_codon:yes gene_type:complete
MPNNNNNTNTSTHNNDQMVIVSAAALYELIDKARQCASAAEFAMQLQSMSSSQCDDHQKNRAADFHADKETEMKTILDRIFCASF